MPITEIQRLSAKGILARLRVVRDLLANPVPVATLQAEEAQLIAALNAINPEILNPTIPSP